MILEKNKNHYLDLGGTIRYRSAEDTMALLTPLLAKIGITRVANVTGLDSLNVPVAISIRPNAKHLSVSQGKGITYPLAYVSAVMESMEGYHAENPPPPNFAGTYAKLKDNYSLANLKLFNTGFFVPDNVEQLKLDWIAVEEMISRQKMYIPHSLIDLDSTKRQPEYSIFSVNSNGLAAGNERDEAICHAVYEIIERDALHRWGQLSDEQRLATQINIDSINAEINFNLIQQFLQKNQVIKIWDITSAVNIPTFHCVMYDTDPYRSLITFRGTGTHLNRDVALSRALTEAAQSRLTLISGSRDDVFIEHYQQPVSYKYSHNIAIGQKNYNDCIQINNINNFQASKKYLLEKLQQQGISQVFMLDHTKPELKIPVVHIIIPSMGFTGVRI